MQMHMQIERGSEGVSLPTDTATYGLGDIDGETHTR